MRLVELAQEYGLAPKKVASTEGGEWKSACPKCGGSKRFRMQPFKNGKRCSGIFACRECGLNGDTISFEIDVMGRNVKEVLTNQNIKNSDSHYKKTLLNKMIARHMDRFVPKKTANPVDKWIEKGTSFVAWAHRNLLANPIMISLLEKRGIDFNAIKNFNLGFNTQELFRKKNDWGLEEDGKQIWLPEGIVIPSYRSGSLIRLKIRRTKWQEGDKQGKYINIAGNKQSLNLFGNTNNPVMFVVESELDAIVVANQLENIAFAIGVGSNVNAPDVLTDYLATNKNLFICYDNDEAGIVMLHRWKRLYPHAQACPTPIGKDIGEAIQQGFNIREWLLSKIAVESHSIDVLSKSNAENDCATQSIETINEAEKINPVEISNKEINALSCTHDCKAVDDWVPSDRPLIEWWLNLDRSKLPQEKFYLSPVEPIKDPEAFYSQIYLDIKEGSKGEGARCGSLQGRLIKLKRYVERL